MKSNLNLGSKNLFSLIQRPKKGILRNFYINLKIKNKLFLIHFLIVLIVCSTSLIAIQVTLSIYEGILGNESAKVLNLSTISIENELKQVERFSYHIISNPDIQKSLEKLKTKLTHVEKSREENILTDSLWTITFEKNITSVSVIDAWGNQFAGGTSIPESMAKQIIPKAAEKEGALIFLEPVAGDSTLICARQIRKSRHLSLEPLGTLIVRVNMDRFVQQATAGSVNDSVNLLIISGKKSIYASNPFLKKTIAHLNFKGNTGYSITKLYGKNYFVAYTRSAFTHWMYINFLPYETVFKKIILMRSMVLLIFMILFLLTIFIGMRLARNLTKPIENLTVKMKQVENGKFDLGEACPLESLRTDEIGDLQKDFSIMIQKINALIKEDYTKQIVIKDAQLKALQAQINPHFLYNTLESINWLAKMNKQKDISLMVESLGHLLRSAISSQEQIITIKEEIGLLQDYITIQKFRFGDRLDFQLEIAEEWQELLIPKLSLQPVVENSINYGLERMPDASRIRVTSSIDQECLEIIVEDNGPGIDEEVLEKLAKGMIKPKGLGIGLKNINERIKLIFGGPFGITITSELGKGTRVVIRVPKTRVENV